MGVKDLWTVLTPHAERKPLFELRGKTVAIDLAGWVCESLNVVDFFVHPRQHLKNLFFRTCYLIWEEVTPVFVLEGVAPKLKSKVMAKRNEVQFRGVKPKAKGQTQQSGTQQPKEKGRTRFNHVLKQCETLLHSMGIQCVQGPGEAEAYCAFLNKNGLVDGVISQDSDCFAYGAVRVYRNFSVSTQGASAAQGGAVDIYDMQQICDKMDFGQHKVIVMALLCGCDYCPDGVGGVGRDSVVKLFQKYENNTILNRIRSWRSENSKYTALEMRVDDKTICSNCGHLGRTQSHTKSGCGVCRSNRGCDESLWKEERLSLKAELMLRKKALADEAFPSEEIIQEFLTDPPQVPNLNLNWKQPNIVKFVNQIGHLLQWTEIYCFQKFFPILTRWQVRNRNTHRLTQLGAVDFVRPLEILKKRTVKGVQSLELIWQDEKGFFGGLIPDDQLKEFEKENANGIQDLWSTVEPLNMLEQAYPEIVESFMRSKEKPKKAKNPRKQAKQKLKLGDAEPLGSLENLNDLIEATNEIAKTVKPKRAQRAPAKKKGEQLIDKFFKQKIQNSVDQNNMPRVIQCSTPITKCLPSDLESDGDDEAFNMSDIVNGIIGKATKPLITKHAGRLLHYEPISNADNGLCLDDLDVMAQKRQLSLSFLKENKTKSKRISLDDSFDVLVNKDNQKLKNLMEKANKLIQPSSHVERFKLQNRISMTPTSFTIDRVENENEKNTSYFFDHSGSHDEGEHADAFEKLMDYSFSKGKGDIILISDSSGNEATN